MRLIRCLIAAAVVAAAAAPTPESHFGHRMGEDRKLIPWDRTVAYFQALEKSSDRIVVRELGKTTMGRPFIAAWISAPATLKQLEKYRQIQKKLADPRKTAEAEAAKLIQQGKVVVMITCSIHSTEVASTHTAVEFAYRMLTETNAKFATVLENAVFILVPSLNPDGVDIVRDWYVKTLGTPHEGSSPPELYQKYVGHDNNRDWYMFSQVETRLAIEKLHNTWHPQIVYDVHQQGQNASRMFIPPWMDPIEPNIDPLITQMCNFIGMGMAMDLTAAGKKGISVNSTYDFWTPARHYQAYHGGMRILSESASARLATPVNIRPEQISQTAPGYLPRQSSWNHLEPWLGGEWRLRDIVDYQSIAWESLLYQASQRRLDLLRNFYTIGQRAVARTVPYAFTIPFEQRDPGAARLLLETLAFGLVEIEKGAAEYVIKMQQPYSSWAKALLEKQEYPDLRQYPGGPPKRPYDVTAHTLPMLLGVEVKEVRSYAGATSPVASFVFPSKGLPTSDTDTWKEVNRVWARGASVWRNAQTGDFSLKPGPGLEERKPPRMGLYRSFQPSMDEGWTRWIFEQLGFPYASVKNPEILAGKLRERYEAIVFPDQGPSVIHNGYRPGAMPAELTGGLGEAGAAALLEFARAGGTLIFLNDSTDYAIGHLGVPLKNVIRGVSSRDFYSPGSLLRVSLEEHPLTRGLPKEIAIWSEGSPAWEVTGGTAARSIARYPESGVLASGWLLGERHLIGRSALVEVPMGQGRIVLFGMRPQYRAQSYQAMKLLFNAMTQ